MNTKLLLFLSRQAKEKESNFLLDIQIYIF